MAKVNIGKRYAENLRIAKRLYNQHRFLYDNKEHGMFGLPYACYICSRPFDDKYIKIKIGDGKYRFHKKCLEEIGIA